VDFYQKKYFGKDMLLNFSTATEIFCTIIWNFQIVFFIFDFVSLDACGAYSSFASLKKILTFLRPYGSKRYAITKEKIKKSSFYFVLCSLIRIFAPSLDSSFVGGGQSMQIINKK